MSAPTPSRRWSTTALCLCGLPAALAGYALGRGILPRDSSTSPTPAIIAASPDRARPARSASSADDLETRWKKLAAEAHTPASARACSDLLENLARTDPQRALALALAEGNWRLRDQLRDAALRGWGATAPDAAADWAMNNRLDVRMQCVSAVLTGAAENPRDAVRVALRLCKADPEPAADYGHTLISALIDKTGDFSAAAAFAAAVGTERRHMLLDSAYFQYARHQPEKALSALAAITDDTVRESARAGLFSGWADADAHQLAEYAQKLPVGEDRAQAFAAALPRWVERDPAAATEWIGQFDPAPDLDAGVATVATLPSLISHKPEIAMEWAGNITDQGQRLITKHAVFIQWAENDLAAARRFAEASRNEEERDMMREALNVISATR